LDWIGLDWIGLDWIGLDWIGLDWIGLDWIGLDWIGLDCMVWFGLVWMGSVRFGLVDALLVWLWFSFPVSNTIFTSRRGQNDETREKLGVTRLLETLESVMWCNMQMKEERQGGASSRRPPIQTKLQQPEEAREAKEEAKEEAKAPEGYAPLAQSVDEAECMSNRYYWNRILLSYSFFPFPWLLYFLTL
jgi:hypothetical protein